jgi:trk system potassium uptake protein TrkH
MVTTLGLCAGGVVGYLVFEWSESLGELSPAAKVVNAWFMAVTARTAGFNTVPYTALGNDAAFLTMLLMFVGGSPGSTAGGIKTTALAVLVASAWSRVRGRRFVEVHDRAIPRGTLERTVTLVLLAVTVLTVAYFALAFLEHSEASPAAREEFLPLAFEAVSAFATVGLSMDMTTRLETPGRVVVVLLMFIGRVGLLSFFAAVTLRRRRTRVSYRLAEEELVIG